MDVSGFWTAPFPSEKSPSWPDDELLLAGTSPDIFEASDLATVSGPGSIRGDADSNPEIQKDISVGVATSTQELVQTRRKPIPRKGHTKSRKGCYSCKKRKVKCQETRPSCENCQKAETKCEYPKPKQEEVVLHSPTVTLQSTPTMFSMTDMRLFHHFVVKAYPSLPVGADSIWTLEMPAYAHEV